MTIEEHNAAIVYDQIKETIRNLSHLQHSDTLSPIDKVRLKNNADSLVVTLRNLEGSFPSIGDY
jgi:hypothetical protein